MKTIDDFSEYDCLIDKILHLKSILASDSPSEVIGEFLNDIKEYSSNINYLINKHNGWNILLEEWDSLELTEFLYCMLNYNLTGYLAEVSTPVKTFKGEGHYSYSWGNCYKFWVYGNTIKELEEEAIEWSKKMYEEDEKKISE